MGPLFSPERHAGPEGFSWAIVLTAGFICAWIVLRAELRRRRLSLKQLANGSLLSILEISCTMLTMGFLAALLPLLIPRIISDRAVPLDSPLTWRILGATLIFAFIWAEGRRQTQYQRPAGIVLGEWLILAGAYPLLEFSVFSAAGWPGVRYGIALRGADFLAIIAGAIVLVRVVPPFLKGYEGHRIIGHLTERGQSIQAEYTPATPECPHPELWHMVDSVTTEVEVMDFLKALVVTVKPQLIVETGTFLGYSTIKMAEGQKANGFGRLITIEYDPEIFAKAKERIDASGLGGWIECRNGSSLETRIDGTIDLLFSDSKLAIREEEIRRFLPQMDPRGLILIHDADSHSKVVREFALRLEREGLLSVVLLPTPRGLVIAQKCEQRK